MDLKKFIFNIPDFPKPGVLFRDITPIFMHPEAFVYSVDWFKTQIEIAGVSKIVAVESRGFLFAAPVAYAAKLPLAIVRKRNKLPREKASINYQLEYGEEVLEIHTDAIDPSDTVAIVDDVLATGGTVAAVTNLLQKLGASVKAAIFLIELEYLNGRANLGSNVQIESLIRFGPSE